MRVYRFLFRFLGPAQLGSDAEPPTAEPDPEFVCPICGHPMSEHSWIEDAGRRRMYCPAPPQG
jgi:hypothetical protein